MVPWDRTRRRCLSLTRTIRKNSGLPRYEAQKLNDMTKERVQAGFQIGFHAIGDKGVQMALDAFAGAEKRLHMTHT
jgi:predicted amidohydrolase YtcJ